MLDEQQKVRSTDPDTSHAWAERFDVMTWRERIVAVIKEAGLEGAGKPDFTRVFGAGNAILFSPIPAPLARAGIIFDSGKRRDKCIVWMHQDFEQEWLDIASKDEFDLYEKGKARALGKQMRCPCCDAVLIHHRGKLTDGQGDLF